MQNKKLIFIMGVLLLWVGAAAFTAGRLLNQGVVPLGLLGLAGDGISILPAEELPKTLPEEEGLFVGLQDNIILVETDQPGGGGVAGSPVGMGGGPQVEDGTLDDLKDSQSLVMVWGRKSGDRIIAEVLVYSNPAYLQKP